MSYGASPEDWASWRALGLTTELLPVVSDPTAKISPKSNMKDLGKVPSRFNRDGEAVGVAKWPQHRATETEIDRWSADSRLGICLQARRVKAFDIDIPDPVHAAAVAEMIEMGAGVLPARGRSNSGKLLLAFALDVEFPKRIIRTEHGNIELLSTGQQFIVCGTHPSGARYEWRDTDGDPVAVPPVVPELSLAEVNTIWQALIDMFALPDGATEVRNGVVPARQRVADDMQDPVVGFLAENDWITGYERDGKVNVRCPWEDEHTSDTGPSATTWFPAGVGGFQQGHFRCLHAHCAARHDGEFLGAIGYVAGDFDVVVPEPRVNPDGSVQPEPAPLPAFTRARNGQIESTLNNVLMAVRRPDVCGARIGFDEFISALMISPTRGGGLAGEVGVWRRFTDTDYTSMRSALQQGIAGFKEIGAETMKEVARLVGDEFAFDSAIEWSKTLCWDGVPRVESFYARYFNVEDTPYSRACALYTWTALAGRCVSPGVKADMVPVLIGLQGAGKTSAVEVLSPLQEGFVEINLERKDDDLARSMRGKLVGEIAELRGLQTRDSEAIKAWISRRTEEWTPKYREFAVRFQRRLLLIGTGNTAEILDDVTGERRWLPMRVGVVDLPALEADRDQLWAEGLVLFTTKGVLWQKAFELAKFEHAAFKVSDPWSEIISDWLERSDMDGPRDKNRVRMLDVLLSALGLTAQKISRKDELRAGKVLRSLGYQSSVARVDGVCAKVWSPARIYEFVNVQKIVH